MCCKDCGYHYKADGDKYPCCHFYGPEGWAPCEQEEDYDTPDYDPEVCEDDAE